MANKTIAAAAAPEHDDWQARDDLHTLTRAHQIRNDPKRHAAVKKHASNQMKVLKAMATGKTPPKTGGNNPLY